ncbi:MAG: DUF4982 domain-containing protein [Sedimentisphaerales bacterium]|nr:DUF4982 domain-containing protein [Sedimentisphaerales bacterium]
MDVSYVSSSFNDAEWHKVNLPHDYAIEGPFITTGGGGMGRLPTAGAAWYRKHLTIPASDSGKQIFLEIDGSMSYTTVWCNGQIAGGWPYGYSSWQVDLTPYVRFGSENVLAIRLDNQPNSSRWYPGAGIYRNVWLTMISPVHVGQWGTYITTPEVSKESASVSLKVTVANDSKQETKVSVSTEIFEIDSHDRKAGKASAVIPSANMTIRGGKKVETETKGTVTNPKLWGTGSNQKPNRYVAVTTVKQEGKIVDTYETVFGIRTIKFDSNVGFILNGEHIKINGVNNHHDLGGLGAAFNYRAAERQLEILAEMGCNAIRTSHNPPAPELLDLADKMGFLIMDEAFDIWERQKTPNDYHLVYTQWHEQDLRAMLRRDRNHPSVIMWSVGNEVGEQSSGAAGAAVTKELADICHEEDPARPVTAAMNSAKPDNLMPVELDVISLNYQGEGIRYEGAYAGLRGGNQAAPQFPAFHEKFPDKVILSSENAAALSTRGTYLFPVYNGNSSPVRSGQGGDQGNRYVSAYELYSADFGSSADKVFSSLDRHPYVARGFVWSGWDYLGEPTPYDASRSSYFGIIDLAGFKKDRFYLYQSYWRPDVPMAHILPHWTWADRVGEVTPVHVFTSGDEAELFLNGKSLGRKKKGEYEYRLRWDDVKYESGELKVIAYKGGKEWAKDVMRTAGDAAKMSLELDRTVIDNDGYDLSFITLTVQDSSGIMVPRANNPIRFSVSGPGEIVAADNGDPTDFTVFPSHDRKAFNGLALVIVKAKRGQTGSIVITAESDGIPAAKCTVTAK